MPDIVAEPDNMTRRGWRNFADTLRITFSNAISESDSLSRHCVDGDVHPVGNKKHLNNQQIYGRQFVVPLKPRSGCATGCERGDWPSKRGQPAESSSPHQAFRIRKPCPTARGSESPRKQPEHPDRPPQQKKTYIETPSRALVGDRGDSCFQIEFAPIILHGIMLAT